MSRSPSVTYSCSAIRPSFTNVYKRKNKYVKRAKTSKLGKYKKSLIVWSWGARSMILKGVGGWYYPTMLHFDKGCSALWVECKYYDQEDGWVRYYPTMPHSDYGGSALWVKCKYSDHGNCWVRYYPMMPHCSVLWGKCIVGIGELE